MPTPVYARLDCTSRCHDDDADSSLSANDRPHPLHRLRPVSQSQSQVIVGGTLIRRSPLGVTDIQLVEVRVSSLVFVERNVGGRKLNILVT